MPVQLHSRDHAVLEPWADIVLCPGPVHAAMATKTPSLFVTHGGGPLPLLGEPPTPPCDAMNPPTAAQHCCWCSTAACHAHLSAQTGKHLLTAATALCGRCAGEPPALAHFLSSWRTRVPTPKAIVLMSAHFEVGTGQHAPCLAMLVCMVLNS